MGSRLQCREGMEWHLLWDEAHLPPGAVPASEEMQTVGLAAGMLKLEQPG